MLNNCFTGGYTVKFVRAVMIAITEIVMIWITVIIAASGRLIARPLAFIGMPLFGGVGVAAFY
jgi:hypothetical protein